MTTVMTIENSICLEEYARQLVNSMSYAAEPFYIEPRQNYLSTIGSVIVEWYNPSNNRVLRLDVFSTSRIQITRKDDNYIFCYENENLDSSTPLSHLWAWLLGVEEDRDISKKVRSITDDIAEFASLVIVGKPMLGGYKQIENDKLCKLMYYNRSNQRQLVVTVHSNGSLDYLKQVGASDVFNETGHIPLCCKSYDEEIRLIFEWVKGYGWNKHLTEA